MLLSLCHVHVDYTVGVLHRVVSRKTGVLFRPERWLMVPHFPRIDRLRLVRHPCFMIWLETGDRASHGNNERSKPLTWAREGVAEEEYFDSVENDDLIFLAATTTST